MLYTLGLYYPQLSFEINIFQNIYRICASLFIGAIEENHFLSNF